MRPYTNCKGFSTRELSQQWELPWPGAHGAFWSRSGNLAPFINPIRVAAEVELAANQPTFDPGGQRAQAVNHTF